MGTYSCYSYGSLLVLLLEEGLAGNPERLFDGFLEDDVFVPGLF